MGYSFRDINIRIIWFKLMEMMRDIPESDRRPSYIVRTERNPVLEDLYGAVGLKTIVLYDGSDPLTTEERTRLLAEFLMRLGDVASPSNIPGQSSPRFASTSAIEQARNEIEIVTGRASKLAILTRPYEAARPLDGVPRILRSRVPKPLTDEAKDVVWTALRLGVIVPDGEALQKILDDFGPSPAVTLYAARMVISAGAENSERNRLLNASSLDWKRVWSSSLEEDDLDWLTERLSAEVEFVKQNNFDEDIAYVADIAKRVTSGQIYELKDPPSEKLKHLQGLLDEAERLLSSLKAYTPDPEGPPSPEATLVEIGARADDVEWEGEDVGEGEDVDYEGEDDRG